MFFFSVSIFDLFLHVNDDNIEHTNLSNFTSYLFFIDNEYILYQHGIKSAFCSVHSFTQPVCRCQHCLTSVKII